MWRIQRVQGSQSDWYLLAPPCADKALSALWSHLSPFSGAAEPVEQLPQAVAERPIVLGAGWWGCSGRHLLALRCVIASTRPLLPQPYRKLFDRLLQVLQLNVHGDRLPVVQTDRG